MKLINVDIKTKQGSLTDVNLSIQKPGIYGVLAKKPYEVDLLFDAISQHMIDSGEIEGKMEDVAWFKDASLLHNETAKSIMNLLKKTTFDQDTYSALLKRFNLDKLQRMAEMSAGQKCLFVFCLIASMNKQVYLFNEPFSHLDSKHIKMVQEIVFDLFELGKTVCVSSQSLIHLERLITDIIVIKNQSIQYTNPITALSYMTMNGEKKESIGQIERLNKIDYLHETKHMHDTVDLKMFYLAYMGG